MDLVLRNNQVRIYSAYYSNGHFVGNNKIYDSYDIETPEILGRLACVSPAGCTEYRVDFRGNSGSLYEVRKLNPIKYKAYKVEIKPNENTQESYDNVVTPFLSLDDIGVTIRIHTPIIYAKPLDIKSEHLDDVINLNTHNENIPEWNGVITSFYEKIKNLFQENHTEDEILEILELHIEECDPKYKDDVKESIVQMMEDFKYYRENNTNDYSNYGPNYPILHIYFKHEQFAPYTWYNHKYDVIFNGDTKLYIDCHEQTKTYSVIDDFLNR